MDDIQETFFELLRMSLGRERHEETDLSGNEWIALYEMAERHAMLGVCLVGLETTDKQGQRPLQALLLQWIGIAQQVEARNKAVNRQCLNLIDRLHNDGFRGCILKGQGNARMYGLMNPQLALWRQSGDIDVWVEGGFEKVIKYVQSICPTDEVNEQHIHFHLFEDTEIEVHFTPSRLANRIRNKRLQQWLAAEQDRQMNHQVEFCGKEITVPSDDFNLVYQMTHIYKHLFNEGVGLRQLMDYCVLLEVARLTNREKEDVRRNVRRFGMYSFACALMWIMGYVFHLPEEKMLWEQDETKGRFLLAEVMQMGNFGHGDNRYRLRAKDSHLRRYLQTVKGKMRFARHYPSEAFWLPVDMFLKFVELRILKRKVKQLS